MTALLAGSALLKDLMNPISSGTRKTSVEYINSRISGIDTESKFVSDQLGLRYPYHYLVLATGSRAFVRSIPGNRLNGVYTFRTLRDAEALCARLAHAPHHRGRRRLIGLGSSLRAG
ncbi:MAG: FAD-dependent oxidoreductase [Methylococcales bacterium]